MPHVRNNVVKLYMASSVDELNNLAELPPGVVKTTNPRLLINTADKLFEQALDLKSHGDEEKSYVSFMKYMNLVSCIRKLPDYRKEKDYFNKLLGAKKVQNAIVFAEELQKALHQRYENKREEKEVAEKFEAMELKLALEREEQERRRKEKEAKEAAATQQEEELVDTISSWSLKNLMDEKSTSFIIFDVRSQEEFSDSRINHPHCYNIPEKDIKPGSSAAMLHKTLPLNTQLAWSKRLTADVIIFVDWFGSREPGSPIFILDEIFTKWDPSSAYKGVRKLLIGGYDEWISRFPTYVSNPCVSKPVKSLLPIDSAAVMNIDYPDLDDEPKKLPEELPVRPMINRSTKPSVDVPADIAPALEKSHPLESNKTPPPVESPPESKAPIVDRQSKSKAVAFYLKAEEEAMEKSLQMAKRALDQENEWDSLRLRKEMEADIELKGQLQQREEELIQRIKKFENDYREQEEEIVKLRQQIKEYENREERSVDPASKGEAILIESRIRQKEEERSNIKRNVELLRQQRKEKEKEEAERKKRREDEMIRNQEEQKRIEDMAKRRAAEELRQKDEMAKRAEEQKRKEEAAKKAAEEEQRRKMEQEARSKKEEAERHRRQEEQRRKLAVDEMDKKKLERREESRRNAEMPHSTFRMGSDRLKDEPSLNSKLNRSHSTPDLAQAIDNEAKESRKQIPSVQRTLKPLMTNRSEFHSRPEPVKNRNFAPVMGRAGRALTGLKNLGNTCYMNSILQCISYTTALTRFFVEETYRKFLNRSSRGTRGDISEELAAVLKALWSGQYRSISCKDFKNAVGRYKSSFSGYEQQDSHEFLTILVDWLHEELNERIKEPLKEQNNCGIPDEKAARMAWDDYLKSNQSIIVSVFGGQQRSSLKCFECGQESVTFEPFFNLSLPIPESAVECSLMDCFQLYTKSEKVSDWSCPSCKKKRNAVKKIDIWRLPPVLVIHLQRFYNDGSWKKRFTNVEYNVTDLNLERVVKSQDPRYKHFSLYAVSNHYGTMNGGHYTAYCRSVEYDRWYKFDDCNVMELKGHEVRSSNAYILFYTARDFQVPQVAALDG